MNTLFLPLLSGHLIADFWLQPSSWIESRKEKGWKSKYLFFHAAIASVVPILFTLRIGLWWFIPIIFVSHYFIDLIKSKTEDNLFAFLIDQIVHIAILWVLAEYCTNLVLPELLGNFWIYTAGFVLATSPSGIMIDKFLNPITCKESRPLRADASAWIGIMERILILIFLLTGQVQGIGFLVAAKSVFRFSEIQKEGNPKAEYFLLGTLVSFLVAIVIGMGVKCLVKG
ncbi:MAG TPA: DUF3307 domain-containing protein [Prolixibacteraceae bacterium]|nr:DUF3307 domain-containing protein [Prolixibacteraceae bacterium]